MRMTKSEAARIQREKPIYDAQEFAQKLGYIAPVIQGPESLNLHLWYNGVEVAMVSYRAQTKQTIGRVYGSKGETSQVVTGGPIGFVRMLGRPEALP